MKTTVFKAGFAVSTLALAISPAMATEVRFDGFASFVAGQVLDKDETIDPTTGEATTFRGFDDRLGFQNNSLFAIQVRADLLSNLSATAQITAKGSDDYNAKFNWAYLTYELSNEVSIKLGRSRIPYFMYSDFLDVGYAYHWIAPPETVYDLGGFDSADGVSIDYQTDIGSWVSRLSFMTGRANTALDVGDGTEANTEVNNLWVVAWNMNYNWLNLRAVVAESDVGINVGTVGQLTDGLAQFGVSQKSIDNMLINNDRASFSGVGISIDPGSFFIVAEYTELDFDDASLPEKDKRWYVSGGMRFGDFTLHATVEGDKADAVTKARDQILTELNQGATGMATLLASIPNPAPTNELAMQYSQLAYALSLAPDLAAGTAAIFDGREEDYYVYSVGLRYNFHPSASAKLEYTTQDNKVDDTKPAAIALAIDLVY
jgi:hypothetical protein